MNKKVKGDAGEKAACDYIINKGYKVIETNYRAAYGEVDIIAIDKHNEYIVFLEVKTRSSIAYGRPAQAVGAKKMSRYFNNAALYAANNNITDKTIRFDIVEVYRFDGHYKINHIINAFIPNNDKFIF